MKTHLKAGRWSGHYQQGGHDFPQAMTLEFADGVMRGGGSDGVGRFVVEGAYRTDGPVVRVGWIKTYHGAHSILYLGEYDGYEIVGHWSWGSHRGRQPFALHYVGREAGALP